jgi:hypothetical protein
MFNHTRNIYESGIAIIILIIPKSLSRKFDCLGSSFSSIRIPDFLKVKIKAVSSESHKMLHLRYVSAGIFFEIFSSFRGPPKSFVGYS